MDAPRKSRDADGPNPLADLKPPRLSGGNRSPVRWARWGFASQLLARLIRPQQPSVVVLSLPRSGSSWVGDILGHAANALYLREPINQTCLAGGWVDSAVSIPADSPPAGFKAIADQAFEAWPNYSKDVVMLPQQWRLSERKRRRLVIKEVFPRACAYFCRCYQPRLIFLVRHPAAVALSCIERGWWSPEKTSWREVGAWQGQVLSEAREALARCGSSRVILYEDLCLNPLKRYEDLFSFAGLEWDSAIAQRIAKASSEPNSKDPYSTTRRSEEMVRAWVPKIAPADLREMRIGYQSVSLPWYQTPEDWPTS